MVHSGKYGAFWQGQGQIYFCVLLRPAKHLVGGQNVEGILQEFPGIHQHLNQKSVLESRVYWVASLPKGSCLVCFNVIYDEQDRHPEEQTQERQNYSGPLSDFFLQKQIRKLVLFRSSIHLHWRISARFGYQFAQDQAEKPGKRQRQTIEHNELCAEIQIV